MNGIIHNCTHGNNPDVRLTEDEMIVKIFSYLDKLFHIVKPQKLLFMAIDGVAPRAKMNQQRARRFKSAKEAEEATKLAELRGDPLPDLESRFDSNCITPGTPFMARLGAHLRFFVRKKISEDTAWQKPTIVFSGHDVPGEGEHKIMEYIRWAKKSPGYRGNTRHCLYGLDADLIMLSLVTHEPHFCLLREVVSYGGGNRGQPSREVLENPCQEHFVLLQVGLLRDYIDTEFRPLASQLPFQYDLERIIDDFVLFCMLVGNDFLPPLPTVDINEGSLDSMIDIYKKILPHMGGYVTLAGNLHRGRLEMLLKELADLEADVLENRALDAEEYDAKRSRRQRGNKGIEELPAWMDQEPANHDADGSSTGDVVGIDGERGKAQASDADASFALEMARLALQEHGHELELLAVEEGEVDPAMVVHVGGFREVTGKRNSTANALKEKKVEEPTMMSKEARAFFVDGDKDAGLAAWRRRYYSEKLQLSDEREKKKKVVVSYLEGLYWVLEYYYRGVASWNWYYPYHYAPMASDCVDLSSIDVTFALGEPFKPFEQLLSVQPSSSCRLLPEPYRWLMLDPASPISDFYPVDFEVDLEGKRAEWEGVVLIPFIDEKRLLKAARSIPSSALTPDERKRNELGDMIVFSHADGSTESSFCESTLPGHFSSVVKSNSTASLQVAPPPLPAGEKGFVPQLVDGTRVGVGGPPGFPTLRSLSLEGSLRRAGCNIFGMTSRKESLILTVKGLEDQLEAKELPSLSQIAGVLVGHRTWVKWPYLQEAQVVAVSDGKLRAEAGGATRSLTLNEVEEWNNTAHRIKNELMTRQGVEISAVTYLLHVRACEGLVRQLDGTVEKRFAKSEAQYPLQVTLRKNPSPDPRLQVAGNRSQSAINAFSSAMVPGSKALFLGRAHYGCMAEIVAGQRISSKKNVPGKKQKPSEGKDEALREEDSAKQGQKDKDSNVGKDTGKLPSSTEASICRPPYRIKLYPAAPNAAQIGKTARRLLKTMSTKYIASNQVARRLGVSPRALGRITGNVWVQTGGDRRDRVDVGLSVKNATKQLYVPDFCAPLDSASDTWRSVPENDGEGAAASKANGNAKGGWSYSEALIRILEQYKQKFPFVWKALENLNGRSDLEVKDLLPGMDHDTAVQHIGSITKWLKSTALSRRPLVKMTSLVAPDRAVQLLQSSLPTLVTEGSSSSSKQTPAASLTIELENVGTALLLPPLDRGGIGAAFAGGTFELGDRVVSAGSSGTPPFGVRGTVVGIYDEGTAVEVLFDEPFIGGSDLFGRCSGQNGALLPSYELLNVSKPHAIRAEGNHKPTQVSGAAGKSQKPSTMNVVLRPQRQGEKRGAAKKTGPPTIDAALALASASLKNHPPAPLTNVPLVPDKSGARGFGMGRGVPSTSMMIGMNPLHLPPGAVTSVGGADLLAQLQKGSGNVKNQSAPSAAGAMPPVASPGQQPGSILLAQLKGNQPQNAGASLLQQLKANAGAPSEPKDDANRPRTRAEETARSNPGAELLQKLQGVSQASGTAVLEKGMEAGHKKTPSQSRRRGHSAKQASQTTVGAAASVSEAPASAQPREAASVRQKDQSSADELWDSMMES